MCHQTIHHHTCGHSAIHPLLCHSLTHFMLHTSLIHISTIAGPCPACLLRPTLVALEPAWVQSVAVPPRTPTETRFQVVNGVWTPVNYYQNISGANGGGVGGRGGWNAIHGEDGGVLPPGWGAGGGYVVKPSGGPAMDLTAHTVFAPLVEPAAGTRDGNPTSNPDQAGRNTPPNQNAATPKPKLQAAPKSDLEPQPPNTQDAGIGKVSHDSPDKTPSAPAPTDPAPAGLIPPKVKSGGDAGTGKEGEGITIPTPKGDVRVTGTDSGLKIESAPF